MAHVACVVGINGGSQQGQRQSVIRVEACWQRRTSTSTIRYNYKEAVVVVVAQKNEYEYNMIQVECRSKAVAEAVAHKNVPYQF